MKLGDLDFAVETRRALERAVEVRKAVDDGRIDLNAVYQGDVYEPQVLLTIEQQKLVREKISECLSEIIDREIGKLVDMGIQVDLVNTRESAE